MQRASPKVHVLAASLGVILPHGLSPCSRALCRQILLHENGRYLLVGIPTTYTLFAALSLRFSYACGRSSIGVAGRSPRPSPIFSRRTYASTENPVRVVHGDFASWGGVSHRRSRC